jgi:hypothetical protein
VAVTSGFRNQDSGFRIQEKLRILISGGAAAFPIENIGTGPDQEPLDQKHRNRSGQVRMGYFGMCPPEGRGDD